MQEAGATPGRTLGFPLQSGDFVLQVRTSQGRVLSDSMLSSDSHLRTSIHSLSSTLDRLEGAEPEGARGRRGSIGSWGRWQQDWGRGARQGSQARAKQGVASIGAWCS